MKGLLARVLETAVLRCVSAHRLVSFLLYQLSFLLWKTFFSLLEVFLTSILFSPSQIHMTYILGKRSTVELACCPGAVESCRLDKIPVPTVSLSHTSCQSVLLHYFQLRAEMKSVTCLSQRRQYIKVHITAAVNVNPRLICLLLFRVPALGATPTCLPTRSPWVV